jgi:hypothetical protein
MTETREEAIARLEKQGDLDPNCKTCQEEMYSSPKMPWEVFCPHHKASPSCESGKYPHCTCDTCF